MEMAEGYREVSLAHIHFRLVRATHSGMFECPGECLARTYRNPGLCDRYIRAFRSSQWNLRCSAVVLDVANYADEVFEVFAGDFELFDSSSRAHRVEQVCEAQTQVWGTDWATVHRAHWTILPHSRKRLGLVSDQLRSSDDLHRLDYRHHAANHYPYGEFVWRTYFYIRGSGSLLTEPPTAAAASVPDWHQLGAALASALAAKLVSDLGPRDFEEFVADWFRRAGLLTELTRYSLDSGVDIWLQNGERRAVVQCKHEPNGTVGLSVVQRTFGIAAAEGVDCALVVTSGKFSSAAESFARDRKVLLVCPKR